MANRKKLAQNPGENAYNIGVVGDHSRPVAYGGPWPGLPEYGITVEQARRNGLVMDITDKDGREHKDVVRFRKDYVDAASPTGRSELDLQQCRTLADGGTVSLDFRTTSGVDRKGEEFRLCARANTKKNMDDPGALYVGVTNVKNLPKEAMAAKAMMDAKDAMRQQQQVQQQQVQQQAAPPQPVQRDAGMDAINAAMTKYAGLQGQAADGVDKGKQAADEMTSP